MKEDVGMKLYASKGGSLTFSLYLTLPGSLFIHAFKIIGLGVTVSTVSIPIHYRFQHSKLMTDADTKTSSIPLKLCFTL